MKFDLPLTVPLLHDAQTVCTRAGTLCILASSCSTSHRHHQTFVHLMTKVQSLIKHALSHLPSPGTNRTVHLALSGGVDSSVAGFLLREHGYNVKPVFLKCWDLFNETTKSNNCFEQELNSAEDAVKSLKLTNSLEIFDLVSTYWTEVFEDVLLKGLENGHTPNPDLACNQFVKFGAFPIHIMRKYGTNVKLATGHYARLQHSNDGENENIQLVAGVDEIKDQSYFLASVKNDALSRFLMPVGCLTKQNVRDIAEFINLPAAKRKSSRGICFIGKQPFADFASQFLVNNNDNKCNSFNNNNHTKGNFIHVDTNEILASCQWPSWAYTIGQRARIGGISQRLFVLGKQHDGNVIVTTQSDSRLFTNHYVCHSIDWVAGMEPYGLAKHDVCVEYKTCSTAKRKHGRIRKRQNGQIIIHLEQNDRRVAEGQAVVLYKGDICLGAAWPIDQNEYDWKVQNHGKTVNKVNSSVAYT